MRGATKDGHWRWRVPLAALVPVLVTGERCYDEPVDSEPPGVALVVGADGLVQVEDHRLLVLPPLSPCRPEAEVPARVRLVTWNIATARYSSLTEVAHVLQGLEADLVLLQETDVDMPRSLEVDQPQELADALEYEYVFAGSVEADEGSFGLTVLSGLPFAAAERVTLLSRGAGEPRIALDVVVCAGSQPLRVVDVHADYMPEGNANNLVDLGKRVGWLEHTTTILAGDFNAEDDSEGMLALLELTGAFDVLGKWDRGATIDTERLDYVLVSPALVDGVSSAHRVQTEASDHLPLVVELSLENAD